MGKKKTEKRNRFQSPWLWDPQYTETGSEKEEVLTGCPCGGCCLCTGLKMEVCMCKTHMDVYMCVLCSYKCKCVCERENMCVFSWQGLLRRGPLLQRWQTSSGLSVCCVGDDSYLYKRVCACSSQWGGAVHDGGQYDLLCMTLWLIWDYFRITRWN